MALTKVQTNAIADDAVTTDKLANAINTARDANTAKVSLADNSVTLDKMAGGTDGQIITYDASGDPVAVGPGTDGQVLTSTGAGSPPAFEAIPAGVSLSGSTDNTVVTVTGANAMQGEANLTYDGTTLKVGGDSAVSGTFHVEAYNGSGDCYNVLAGTTGAGLYIADTGSSEKLGLLANGQASITSYKDGDPMVFSTTDGSGTGERVRIDSAGAFLIGTTVSNSFDFKVSDGGGYEFAITCNDNSRNNIVNYDRSGSAYVDARQTQKELHIWTGTSPAEAMKIDSSGYVTKPKQPSFRATNLNNTTGSTTLSAGNQIFYSAAWNTGSHYDTSNGKFTAPVAGKYFFYANIIYNDSGATTHAVYWKKNGSRIIDQHFCSVGGQWDGTSYQATLNMAANDYMELEHTAAAAHGGSWSHIGGWLLH